MGVIHNGIEIESMTHNGVEVQTWTHNGMEVYSAGKMVTYVVDTGTTYQEKVKKGQSCLAPTTFTPTKSGWTFVGWREDKTASGTVLGSKMMEKNPITLYAVFKQAITCYTYNGSSTRTSTTGTRYYNNGNIVNPSFKLSQNGMSGWSANGWCTSSGATASIAVANGGTVTLSADATYYGRYSQTITLSYNGNGNSGGSTAAQTGTRYYNSGNYSNPSFTIRSNGFSRTNASFKNWALGSTSGTRYNAGASITLSASSTLYAKWTVTTTTTETAYYIIPGGKYYVQSGSHANVILAPTSRSGGGTILTLSGSNPYLNKAVSSLSISLSAKMRIPGYSSGDEETFTVTLHNNGTNKKTVNSYTIGSSTADFDFSCSVGAMAAGTFYLQMNHSSGCGARFEDQKTMTVTAKVISSYEA